MIVLSGLFYTSCDEPGTNILFSEEFVELDAATTVTGSKLYTYLRINDGVSTPSEFLVNLSAAQRSTATNFSFEIDPESTAIENLHYTVNGNSGTIAANSNIASLPIDIMDDNINAGEKLTIIVNLTSADVTINPNYVTAIHEIQVTCPIDGKYLGDYAVTYVDATFPFGPATFGEEGKIVTLMEVSGSTSKRMFSYIYLESGDFGQGASQFTFDLNCNNVVIDADQIGGLSCDGSDITIGPDETVPAYDENDDSTLELVFQEFVLDGGCGVAPPVRQVVVLVKQ